jgi:hypothetical protein
MVLTLVEFDEVLAWSEYRKFGLVFAVAGPGRRRSRR